jgi:ribosome-associated protein
MRKALLNEIVLLTSRSSGPGGQHVNRTESKVELHWNLEESCVFDDAHKALLRERIGRRLTASGELVMTCQATRSQLKNRSIVEQRFLDLIERSLKPRKKRIATRPTRSSVEKRLKAKKARGEKKQRRSGGSME